MKTTRVLDGDQFEVTNETAYCTDDLIQLMHKMMVIGRRYLPHAVSNVNVKVGFRYRSGDPEDMDPEALVSCWPKGEYGGRRRRGRRHSYHRYGSDRGVTDLQLMYLPRPSHMDHMSPLELFAEGVQQQEGLRQAPRSLYRQIAEYFAFSIGVAIDLTGKCHRNEPGPIVLPPPEESVLRIRKVSKPKRTNEEKAENCLKQYDLGRVLNGGSRRSRWYWAGKINQAQYHYKKEWERCDEWRQKAEKYGYEFQPGELHETFPEYLRRLADELETRGYIR
jgi:hypothetical protein